MLGPCAQAPACRQIFIRQPHKTIGLFAPGVEEGFGSRIVPGGCCFLDLPADGIDLAGSTAHAQGQVGRKVPNVIGAEEFKHGEPRYHQWAIGRPATGERKYGMRVPSKVPR